MDRIKGERRCVMSDAVTPFARLWAAIQTQPKPSRVARDSWRVTGIRPLMAYDAVLAVLPRPVTVYRYPLWHWRWYCRLCGEFCPYLGHKAALHAGLDHLHTHHGCPNRHTTGEPCHDTCVHCRGWQWCAAPTTERSDW